MQNEGAHTLIGKMAFEWSAHGWINWDEWQRDQDTNTELGNNATV